MPLSFRQNKEAGALELIRVQDNQMGSGAAAGPRLFLRLVTWPLILNNIDLIPVAALLMGPGSVFITGVF